MNALDLSDQGRRKLRAVLQGLVFANLVLWICVSLFIYVWQTSLQESIRREQELTVSNLAQSLSQTINAELELADARLRDLVFHLEGGTLVRQSSPEALDKALHAEQTQLPMLDALRLTDAQGKVMYGKGVNRQGLVDVSAERIFQQARSAHEGELLVSEPHISPMTQKWVVTLARRVQHPDGSFAGMLYGVVDVAHFNDLFASVQLSSHGAISLRTSSMQLVARVSTDQAGPPQIGSRNVSAELAAALKRAPLFGVYSSPTALDGIVRVNAYCRVLNFPLLVIAGQGGDIYQGPWLKQISQIGFLCFLCLLALALVSLVAYGAMRRELVARDAMEREFLHSRTLIDASSDGIHVLNEGGVLVQVNTMFAQMLGYRVDVLLGRSLDFCSDLPLTALTEAPLCLASGATRRVDARYRKIDGSLIDVEVSVSQVETPQGMLTYCSARDSTARRAVEQRLLRTSALLAAFDQASDSARLVVHHGSDAILYFNPQFCGLWNLEHLVPALEAGKLTYSQLLLAMHPLLANPQAFFASRMALEDETQSLTLDDSILLLNDRWVRRHSAPVHDVHGDYVGRLYVFDEATVLGAPAGA